ncbi:pentapeptide repeat-containing protein [Streptomyces sp. NPDC002851]
MFVSAIVIAGSVFWMLVEVLDVHQLKTETRLTSQTLFDMVKLSFGVVAGAGALVALIVAYRKQRVDEDGAQRETTRLHTERFSAAVAQLGEPSPAVRLGGVYALAALADDAPTPELRQSCIDVLCAYLRMPYTPDPGPGEQAAHHEYLAAREVRHTIIRLIRDHLRLNAGHPRSWQGHSFDFTGASFDGGDFTEADFSGGHVSFQKAQFTGGEVHFHGAQFTGGEINFFLAEFTGGTVDFSGAEFTGGTVDFSGAEFTGGTVDFSDTEFTGGQVQFNRAQFTGGQVNFGGGVIFGPAQFTGSEVQFNGAQFTGGQVDFSGAEFTGGQVDFRNAGGSMPAGLLPAGGAPAPSGLLLPAEWSAAAL